MPSCQLFIRAEKPCCKFGTWNCIILDWNLKVDLSIHLSSDQLRMLSFSRIFLYRHRKIATHHISTHCHLALYSMLFHVGYFLIIWQLKAALTTETWRWMDARGTVQTCALAAALLCDRGHTVIERRMWEVVINVQWVDQILQLNSTIRTCTFLQILLWENGRGFRILGTNTRSSLHCLLAITYHWSQQVCHFPHTGITG